MYLKTWRFRLSRLDATLVFEALAMGCPACQAFCLFTIWSRDGFLGDELRETYLADLCTMYKIGSYCLTEPGSGSDAAAPKTKSCTTKAFR